MNHHDREAVKLYPELDSLITMREAGWRFNPHFDSEGEVVQLDGFRSGSECTDAIRMRDRTDVLGMRMRSGGRVIWERHGTLREIVRDLLTLPVHDVEPR